MSFLFWTYLVFVFKEIDIA